MPLTGHARRFLEMLAAAGQSRGRYDDVEERRAALANLADLVDPPGAEPVGGVREHLMPVSDGHICLRTYSPLGEPARVLPGILFFHGGGWVAGSLETHDGLCRRLSNETGCRVIAVDYRLAPTHPFPYGLADAIAALNYVTQNPKAFGIDPAAAGGGGRQRRRHLGGGGVPDRARCRQGKRRARRSRFNCCCARSWTCMANPPPAGSCRKAISWTAKPCAATWNCMCPRACELSDVRLSPLCAEEFANLPPAFIHTGQFDPFSDEGEEYAQKLGGFGVAVHGRAHPGMIHYFYCMPRMIPYAAEAMRIIGSEIRYAVKLPQLPERRVHRRIRPELIRA